jgi:hypothetical protein
MTRSPPRPSYEEHAGLIGLPANTIEQLSTRMAEPEGEMAEIWRWHFG